MALEPFRFLHAANLYLDHQLRDVGPLPDAFRDIVERATLLAWDRIVDAAIARQVDFVLLAGNAFDAADHSLTGQVALVQGLERLGERDIPVFIVPGVADPDMTWRLGMSLPDNVTRFGGELSEPVGLSRDGRTFCTLHHVMANTRDLNATDDNGLDELAVFAPPISQDECGPFDIALLETITNDAALPPELLENGGANGEGRRSRFPMISRPAFDPEIVARCPIEYWALGDGLRRQAWRVGRGMAHTPGCPQGLSPADTGPLGCTLVDVDSEGRVRESFIPTARVRYENISVTAAAQTTRDVLVNQLRHGLEAIPGASGEELWLITLQINGTGRLYDELQLDDLARRLWQDAIPLADGGSPRLHLRKIQFGNHPTDLTGMDFLSQELARQIEQWNPVDTLPERLVAASAIPEGPWAAKLQSVLSDIDPQDAVREAHRSGWAWLKQGSV